MMPADNPSIPQLVIACSFAGAFAKQFRESIPDVEAILIAPGGRIALESLVAEFRQALQVAKAAEDQIAAAIAHFGGPLAPRTSETPN